MKRRLEIEDILAYKFLSSLRASPVKERCVFCVSRPDGEANRYRTDLWLYDADQVRALTSHGQAGPALWLTGGVLLFPRAEEETPPAARTRYYSLNLETGAEEF